VFKDRALAGGFTLAAFRPEDAPGVVACYREMYGDNFPMRYVYDPQAIVEKNVHGGQHTLVVRSPKNDVAGGRVRAGSGTAVPWWCVLLRTMLPAWPV
jgi:hypothetical protein